MVGGKWDPQNKRIRKLSFIPTEAEIDQLIAGCGKKMSAFLQLLKETAIILHVMRFLGHKTSKTL